MKRFIAVLAVLAGLWAVCDLTAATVDTQAGAILFTSYGSIGDVGTASNDYYQQSALVGRKVKAITFYGERANAKFKVRNGSATGTVIWAGNTAAAQGIYTVPVDFTLPLKTYVTSDDHVAAASSATSPTLIMHLSNW